MNINLLMQLLNQFGWLKQRLIQLWVNPMDLQNVDFNDPYALNDLAARIMPNLLKANPNAVAQIKNSAKQFVPEKEAEIVEMIGN